MVTRVNDDDGVHHIPLERFFKLDCSASKRVAVLIPNDTSSERSRRDVSNPDHVRTGTMSTMEISSVENRPRGV